MPLHSKGFLFPVRYISKTIKCLIEEYAGDEELKIDFDNSIIFLLACDYNNIGDYLIRVAQIDFIKNICPDKKIVTVGHNDTFKYLKCIKSNVTENALVVLTGGGNTDDKYIGTEIARNQIIKQLRHSGCRIIGFPQTISYANCTRGKFCLKKTRKALSKNSNYVLTTREKVSFRFAKQNFPNTKVILTPDIVLSSDKKAEPCDRSGVGLLMRDDAEKILEEKFTNDMIRKLGLKYVIYKNDMSVEDFDKRRLKDYMNEKISFVRSKKLVVTDRLHGMILCYITNTPCIVFANSNHKILETYKNWLNGTQNFIILEEDCNLGKVMDDAKRLLSIKTIKKSDLSCKFDVLRKEIVSSIKEGK